jgi:hypothetical protein
MTLTGDLRPEYFQDLYGDSTISWVPPVINYAYVENVSKRGINDRSFRWEEVTIDLTAIQSGAVIDFLMPDYYLLQVTPDIGWHDTLAMFGETHDASIQNPHLRNLGPFSISAGTLTDKSDNSVVVELTTEQIESAVIDGYPKYLWRAVPWADGNPGLGGMPASFEWISSLDQLVFAVDAIQKETSKSTQVISGTKSARVNITIESENSPAVFIEQTSTTWKVVFNIDRPRVMFTIIATDEGGSAVSKYYVDMEFDTRAQIKSHVWNAFDGFALLASIDRLQGESNDSLRDRTIDAFSNKGGTHYKGLINGINRELNLRRKDSALTLSRKKTTDGLFIEPNIFFETTHTRLSVWADSFVIHDELATIDAYYNRVTVDKRICNIISVKTSGNQELPADKYKLCECLGTTTDQMISIDSSYSGIVKVTYQYKEDLLFSEYDTVGKVVAAIKALVNQQGVSILDVVLDGTMSGSELSKYLYHTYGQIGSRNNVGVIGWSRIGLYSVSNEEYKWSFADTGSMFFNSKYYQYVVELKSHTNIEWGYIIADKDYWDAVDADWYGRDSLPVAFDVKLSNYNVALPIGHKSSSFDAWEAFRMGYYYEGKLIKNQGFPQQAFKSGVGYKQDCVVSVVSVNVSSRDTQINFNPIVVNSRDVNSYSSTAISSVAVNL